MQNIIESFENTNNRWILNISNTDEGITETIKLLKAALATNKLNSKKIQASAGLRPIADFIDQCYDPFIPVSIRSKNPPKIPMVTSEALRLQYCIFCNLNSNSVSAIRFGRLMSEYIDSDLNKYRIERKAVRTGAAYSGITIKSAVEIINEINNTEVDPISVAEKITPPNVPSIYIPQQPAIATIKQPETVEIPPLVVPSKAPSPYIPADQTLPPIVEKTRTSPPMTLSIISTPNNTPTSEPFPKLIPATIVNQDKKSTLVHYVDTTSNQSGIQRFPISVKVPIIPSFGKNTTSMV